MLPCDDFQALLLNSIKISTGMNIVTIISVLNILLYKNMNESY